jgi:hypothetical protein
MRSRESIMKQELWQRVEELFHAALERVPEARQGFLDGSCSGDVDLRLQVELLLAKEQQAGSFLPLAEVYGRLPPVPIGDAHH